MKISDIGIASLKPASTTGSATNFLEISTNIPETDSTILDHLSQFSKKLSTSAKFSSRNVLSVEMITY